jgi:amino acid transporter
MPKWALYTGIICGLLVVFATMMASYELMSEGRLAGRWISQVFGTTAGGLLAGFSVYGVVLKKKLGKAE